MDDAFAIYIPALTPFPDTSAKVKNTLQVLILQHQNNLLIHLLQARSLAKNKVFKF